MTKNNALEHLDAARRSHIKWLNRAKSMVEGKNMIRDPHPLASTACQFGLWFNDEGHRLYTLLQIEGEDKIHLLHDKLHEKYLNIYEIYFGSAENIVYDQKARLAKRAVSKVQDEEAKNLMQDLKKLSYRMLEEIIHLEGVVKDSDRFD
jgi:hypothetical protein